jgi:hypothetical protein
MVTTHAATTLSRRTPETAMGHATNFKNKNDETKLRLDRSPPETTIGGIDRPLPLISTIHNRATSCRALGENWQAPGRPFDLLFEQKSDDFGPKRDDLR